MLNLGNPAKEDPCVRLKLLLKQYLEEALYDNINIQKQVLSTVFEGIQSQRKTKSSLSNMTAKYMFIEIARIHCPNDIPEVKIEIMKQDKLRQQLSEYKKEATQIRAQQEKI